MPPAFKDHPAIERLSLRRYDQAIVLAPCVAVGIAPVEFKRVKFQFVQCNEQVLAPLITIAALFEPVIYEKIVKDRGAERPVFLP